MSKKETVEKVESLAEKLGKEFRFVPLSRDDLYERTIGEMLDQSFEKLIDMELKREDLFAFAIRNDGVTLVFRTGEKIRIS